MRPPAVSKAGLIALGFCLTGCAVSTLPLPPAPREPARWILVEKRVGQHPTEATAGDGRLDPKATLLVLEPLYPEDLNWVAEVEAVDYFVEVLQLLPAGELAPGEAVTALLRVGGARPDRYYRVVARSSSPQSVILGDQEHTVRGASPMTFRFTSVAGGKAGLKIAVEEVSEGNGRY